jgi:hypothetical protein
MKPQPTHANDEGIDWDKVWSVYVKQSDAREVEAANDNERQAEPTSVGGSGFVLSALLILIVLSGALAGRG